MARKIPVLIPALILSACASLPPTNLPVCGNTRSFEDVCRAPVMCLKKEDNAFPEDPYWCDKTEEKSRDPLWEKAHVCPAFEPIEGHPTLGSCYRYAGARDSRQVYRRVAVRIGEER